MNKLTVLIILLSFMLSFPASVYAQGSDNSDFKMGKPSQKWINLDKANELLKIPGLKFIVSYEKLPKEPDFEKYDPKTSMESMFESNTEVWLLHQNGEKVQLLDKAYMFLNENKSVNGRNHLLTAECDAVAGTEPKLDFKEDYMKYILSKTPLPTLKLTQQGFSILDESKDNTFMCWFGNTDLLASPVYTKVPFTKEELHSNEYKEALRLSNETGMPLPDCRSKVDKINLIDANGKIVKTISLETIKNRFDPTISSCPDGLQFIPANEGLKSGYLDRISDNYYLITENQILGPLKYENNNLCSDSIYLTGSKELVLLTKDFEMNTYLSYKMKFDIPELNPDVLFDAEFSGTVAHNLAINKSEIIAHNYLYKPVGYSSDMKYAYLHWDEFNDNEQYGLAKLDLSTFKLVEERVIKHDRNQELNGKGGFVTANPKGLFFDNVDSRFYYLEGNAIMYLDQDYNSKEFMSLPKRPESLIVVH